MRLFLNHKYAVFYNEKNLPSLIKLAIFTCSLVYVKHRESQMPSYCIRKFENHRRFDTNFSRELFHLLQGKSDLVP